MFGPVPDPSADKENLLRNLGDKQSCVEAVTSGHKAPTIEQKTRDEGGGKRSLTEQRGKDDGNIKFMLTITNNLISSFFLNSIEFILKIVIPINRLRV